MSTNVHRLFEQFQPQSYELTLTPDTSTMKFSGSVTIIGKKTGRPSQRITLHQKDLNITSARITNHDKTGAKEVVVSRVNNHDSFDEVRIHSETMIYPGLYTIILEFNGTITDPMHGLYPCYFTHEGKKKLLLATQFESHHAREVFPCIDEPEAKATFDLTLLVPQNEVALANTPTKSTESHDSLVKTTFETTPIMSTYLLAFVIGEMHNVEATASDGTVMRTWATVAQPTESLQYANDEAVNILQFFADYFHTPFPLSKCDQVALPDFESGAMENWGLITYREIALLTDPVNRSLSSEQYVSMVVAHELSHQWFGNLVTMKWWDDLWLNESFASLMEHIALAELHKDWHQWEQYTASDVISSSSRDVFKDVQSVHVTVNHPDEISTLFDPAIVYAKGGRLLKMMRQYIGDDAFRVGLKSYFAQHAYKNTTGNDLWAAMSESSNKDIKAFMDPWIEQSGMPVLTVTHTADAINITQQRFVLDSNNDTSLWPIPFLANQVLASEIIDRKEAHFKRPSGKPVIFNENGSGHMLVNYADKEAHDYIAEAFAQQTILPESRINILNDHLLLARRGDAPLTDALDIVSKSSSESRDAVWMIISRAISTAMGLVEGDEDTENNIKHFRTELILHWYEKLGWNDKPEDSANEISLRQTVLSFLSASEYEPVLAEAKRRYESAGNATDLPAEQRGLINAAVVKSGADIQDQLIEEYKTTPNPDIQLSICAGLTNTRDSTVGDILIEKALGENGFVRPQDIFRWYAYLMRNRYTRASAWNWLKTSWPRLETMFGDSKSFEYFVVYSASPINTVDAQKEFLEFFLPMSDVVALKRNIAIASSEIEARVQWRNREESRIKQYFTR